MAWCCGCVRREGWRKSAGAGAGGCWVAEGHGWGECGCADGDGGEVWGGSVPGRRRCCHG